MSKKSSRKESKSSQLKRLKKSNTTMKHFNELNVIPEESMEVHPYDDCIDKDFLKNHAKNMVRIREALKESGKYKINEENVEKFINEQLSPIRRQAADDLIKNTIYITLKDTMNIVEELVHQIYERYEEDVRPIMYCSKKNKSFYLFACIALHYIKKHGYQIPTFISSMPEKFLHTVNETIPIIIIDDASYSGSQLSKFVSDIHYIRYKIGLPNLNLTIALTALNDASLHTLSKVVIEKTDRGSVLARAQSPYRIVYLEDRLYQCLVRTLGIERYFYVNLFFNAWTVANIALYLDHKLADSTSTYKNVYVYGPIVPYDYSIEEAYEYDNIINVYITSFFSREINLGLVEDFVETNPDFLTKYPNVLTDPIGPNTTKNIRKYLTNKAIALDEIDKEHTPGIRFYPFIQKCSHSTRLKQIIKDPSVINIKYLFFMFDKELAFLDQFVDIIDDLDETSRVIDLLESHRCPNSFYKNGILKLI